MILRPGFRKKVACKDLCGLVFSVSRSLTPSEFMMQNNGVFYYGFDPFPEQKKEGNKKSKAKKKKEDLKKEKENFPNFEEEPSSKPKYMGEDDLPCEEGSSYKGEDEDGAGNFSGSGSQRAKKKPAPKKAPTSKKPNAGSCPSSKVKRVFIEWTAGEVEIEESEDDDIHYRESGNGITQQTAFDVTLLSQELHIRYVNKGCKRTNLPAKKLFLSLPNNIDLNIQSTSADIEIDGVYTNKVTIATTSGDLRIDNSSITDLSLASVSGDLEANLDEAKSIDVNSVSGDVSLSLPDSASIGFASTSGELYVDGECEGEGEVILRGGKIKVKVQTVSGDCEIETD